MPFDLKIGLKNYDSQKAKEETLDEKIKDLSIETVLANVTDNYIDVFKPSIEPSAAKSNGSEPEEKDIPLDDDDDEEKKSKVAVHSAILDDLVYPAEIVGKRIRFRLDGSRLFKVHLDKNQQTNIEHKVSIS